MRTFTLVGVATLALCLSVACPRAGQTTSSETTEIQSGGARDAVVIVPSAPSPAPYGGESSYVRTEDGYYIAAWYWAPEAEVAPGVILLHMRGRDKSSWGEMPKELVAEGFGVVAIDLRGHGETLDAGGRTARLEALVDADYQRMMHDVTAAHELLAGKREVDGEHIAIIGASIGANLAIMYAAGESSVRTAVALSPGLNYKSLEPLPYLDDYGKRALYLISSEGDQYSFDSCLTLEQTTRADPVSFRKFPGSAHGTDLLTEHPGLDRTIISGWLLNHLPPR